MAQRSRESRGKSVRYFFRACLRALVAGLFLSLGVFINLNIILTIKWYMR